MAAVLQFTPLNADLFQFVVLLVPSVIYLFLNKDTAKRLKEKLKLISFKVILIITAVWFCLLPLKILIITFVAAFTKLVSELFQENILNAPWYLLITSALIPSILEELYLRGIILDGYRKYGVFTASLMNGILFGLMHLNTYQFSFTLISGFVMSYLVFITGSIFASVYMHFLNNGFSYLFNIFGGLFKDSVAIGVVKNIENELKVLGYKEFAVLIIIAILGIIIALKLMRWLIKIYDADKTEVSKIKFKNDSLKEIINLPFILSVLTFFCFNLLVLLLQNKR